MPPPGWDGTRQNVHSTLQVSAGVGDGVRSPKVSNMLEQWTSAAHFAPQGKGTYILVLRLAAPAAIAVGKLGTFDFAAGWYLYVGSAFGPGGLRGRLKHHLAPIRKPHWHIDYLRQHASVESVWALAGEPSREHEWAGLLLALPGAVIPVPRFGASDCACRTHLIGFGSAPSSVAFAQQVQSHGDLQRWPVRPS